MDEMNRRQFLAAAPAALVAAPAAISITKLESPPPVRVRRRPYEPIPLPPELAAKVDQEFLGQPWLYRPVIEEVQDFVHARFRFHAPNACFFRITDNLDIPFADHLNRVVGSGINADTYQIDQVFTPRYCLDIDDIWPGRAKRQVFLTLFDQMARELGLWAEELAKTQPAWVTKPLLYLKREAYVFEVFVWMDYLRRLDQAPALRA